MVVTVGDPSGESTVAETPVAVSRAPMVLAAVTIGLILHGAMYAPQAAFIAELFPTRLRYSGASSEFA